MANDNLLISRPSLGIIGFGAFGQLMARHLRAHFRICAYDPAVTERAASDMPEVRFTSLEQAAGCPIVVIAAPVSKLEEVIDAILPHLKSGSLVLDVGSVKVIPAEIMRRKLPPNVDVVATHPLFGPQSAGNSIRGLKIAICPIRGQRGARVGAFMRKVLGLDVIMTLPEEHDQDAALVQGLTHLIAKVLVEMEPLPTRITTRSFDLILQAVGMVRHDAPEVFRAIEHSNPYARDVRRRFFELAARVDASLIEG
ncbi:MAG: prephenate dehydrogenase/arogenate dehydrogenase family protein [Rhabdaerophilum sp.]